MPKRFISVYEETQQYGGPEEGGWWYGATEHIITYRVSTNKAAQHIKNNLELKFGIKGERIKKWLTVGFNYSISIENKKERGKKDTTNNRKPHYE